MAHRLFGSLYSRACDLSYFWSFVADCWGALFAFGFVFAIVIIVAFTVVGKIANVIRFASAPPLSYDASCLIVHTSSS